MQSILPSAFESLAMDLADSDLGIPCEVSVAGEIVGCTCIMSDRKVQMEMDGSSFVATIPAISIPRDRLPGVPKKNDRIWAGGRQWRVDGEPEQTGAGMLLFTALTIVGYSAR